MGMRRIIAGVGPFRWCMLGTQGDRYTGKLVNWWIGKGGERHENGEGSENLRSVPGRVGPPNSAPAAEK